MYLIRAPSLGKAHELLLGKILKNGEYVVTEDGEETIELGEPLNVHVADPFAPYMISPFNKFGKKAMQQYVDDLLSGTDNEFVYTYHERLFEGEMNQIEHIIHKLREEPESRRAQAITWRPLVDTQSKTPPCLQRIQCFVRNGKLNFYCEFRSNDMLSAWGANVYALAHLQKMIADSLNVDIGWYSHTSTSAHVYHIRDAEELNVYIQGLNIYAGLFTG
jgi:thymidylate synthase